MLCSYRSCIIGIDTGVGYSTHTVKKCYWCIPTFSTMQSLGCGVLWASPPSDQEDCGREVRRSVEGRRWFSSYFMSFVVSISMVVDVLSLCLYLPFDAWWFSPPAGDDLVAATSDLVHPNGVEDVQGDAGGDPGYLSTRPQAVVLGGAKGGHDAGPV